MSVMGKIVPHMSGHKFGRIGASLCSIKTSRNYFSYTQELSQPLERRPEYVTAEKAFENSLKSGKSIILRRGSFPAFCNKFENSKVQMKPHCYCVQSYNFMQ